jgi:hypothetical protein
MALAAVLAVTVGIGLYTSVAGGFLDGLGGREERRDASTLARQAADRVADTARVDGSIRPARLAEAVRAGPTGYRLNATLLTRSSRWRAGPPVPDRAVGAERRVAVHLGPGRVRPAVLRVEVWR